MTDALKILRGLEEEYPHDKFIRSIHRILDKFPEHDFGDAFSRGQMQSKAWLINTLCVQQLAYDVGAVSICGGWFGVLAHLMFKSPQVDATFITSYDLDAFHTRVANLFNEDYSDHFMAKTADCTKVSYEFVDTVINTSCEHFEDFQGWWDLIPSGKLVVLQSNDFFSHPEHVNCVNNVGELADMAPMEMILYMGDLPTYKYTRFMVVGRK